MDDRVWRHDAVRGGVRLDHLELHRVHRAPHEEEVALLHGAVGLEEVRLEVHVEQVPRHALDGVVDGEDVHALPVRDVPARRDRDHVGEAHAQVLAHNLVHPHAGAVARLVGQDDAHGVPPLLPLDQDRVAAEEGQLLHLRRAQGYDRVVVVRGVVHHEAVGRPLLAQDGLLHVRVLFVLGFHHGLPPNIRSRSQLLPTI
mmetsp:Transcript_1537/g.3370  ORF Transcript_1537/g.3370 Transcript_1537/m.3370 type:complete len:200 (+) Transcript_1537:2059-2658(+)